VARDEVARLQADCREARAAAATATREVADLLDHSASLEDGFFRSLAEIEAQPTETLLPPREAERLRARLVELEGQVAEATTARAAVEDDLARALRVRDEELQTVRGELGALQARLKGLAALEAEGAELRARIASTRAADDELALEVAAHLGSVPAQPARIALGRSLPDRRPAEPRPPARQPAVSSKPAANGTFGFEPSSPSSASVVDANGVDLALDLIDLRELLPQPRDPGQTRPVGAAPQTPAPEIEADTAARPPVDVDAIKAEALRLRTDVLERISRGRKDEAEILARRMVDLNRLIAGELSPDHSTWMTVVGQLQAEQGDWPGARATFDRKNSAFRDRFGERDPRYLSCVADSAQALLMCGDSDGAKRLFEEADAMARQALDASHPFIIAVREKLGQLRGQGHNAWTVRAST
jgi:hypothetical protein